MSRVGRSRFEPLGSDGRRRLIDAAWEASRLAYAPYSGYRVGAALLTEAGQIITGCNIESASYGLTCCAERVALFKARSAAGTASAALRAVAVAAAGSLPLPCGACLQVLHEHGPAMEIIVAGSDSLRSFYLADLLPHPFQLTDDAGG